MCKGGWKEMGGEICHFDLLGVSGRTCMIVAAVFLRASFSFTG
jgi:hypothetical protein